jgi:hypothetical protein
MINLPRAADRRQFAQSGRSGFGERVLRVTARHGPLAIAVAGSIGLTCACGTAVAVEKLAETLYARPLYAQAFTADDRPRGQERYFVDFRARPSTYIGHSFIVYGRMDSGGRVTDARYAGLIPEVDAWRGLVFPAQGSVRGYVDDTRLTPTIIYRRYLTAGEFSRVAARVRLLQATQHQWHALFFNCNDFAIEIAETLGMRRPPSLMPPHIWVATLRALNGP